VRGLVDHWGSVLASGEPGESEGRLRRFNGVYRWFLFCATPLSDNDGRVVRWFGTNTDIEDRKRAERFLAGENLVLEMTAKGNSLESVLEALCRVVEQAASGSLRRLSEDINKPEGAPNGNLSRSYSRGPILPKSPAEYNVYVSYPDMLSLGQPWTVAGSSKLSRNRVPRVSLVRFSIVPHAQQVPDKDEDQAMRVVCYLICAMSVAMLVGLFFYTMVQ
jgi:hypothetical protein